MQYNIFIGFSDENLNIFDGGVIMLFIIFVLEVYGLILKDFGKTYNLSKLYEFDKVGLRREKYLFY